MNQYEITIITKENLKGEPAKKEIVALGGKVLNITDAEERRFAYPIKKEGSGYYSSLLFEIAPEKVLELNKKLGLDSEVLRHLIITYKAAKIIAPKAPAVVIEPKKEIEKVEAPEIKEEIVTVKEVIEPKEEPSPATLEKEKKTKKVKETIKKEEEPKKVVEEPVKRSKETEETMQKDLSAEDRLKALDKKLDELLKE